MRDQMTDAALASLGSKTVLAGSAGIGVGVVTSSAFIGYLGLAVAAIGVALNVMMNYRFKARENQRREREHLALMRRLERDYERSGQ